MYSLYKASTVLIILLKFYSTLYTMWNTKKLLQSFPPSWGTIKMPVVQITKGPRKCSQQKPTSYAVLELHLYDIESTFKLLILEHVRYCPKATLHSRVSNHFLMLE